MVIHLHVIRTLRNRHRISQERELSSLEQDHVKLSQYSHAKYVDNNTKFGSVRCLSSNVYQSAGIAQKRFQLCYRCLAEGHHGKSSQRTRRCGKNGCHKVHHRLPHLHQDTSRARSEVFEAKSNTRPCSAGLHHEHQRSEAPFSAHVISATDGKRFSLV